MPTESAPQAINSATDILQYIQAAGPLGIAVVLAYLWKQFVQPVLDAQRADFDKALKAAEERAERDRAAHERATREGMQAVSNSIVAGLENGLRASGDRIAGELRRVDDHLTQLAAGAGCAAAAQPATTARIVDLNRRRPASAPPGIGAQ